MQYALLVYLTDADQSDVSPEQMEAIRDEYFAIRDDERVFGGSGLEGTEAATTVREKDGSALLTDGPFADTKEFLGGFYLVDAPDIDGAVEIAKRIPAVRLGGAVEIRPLMGPYSD